MNHAIMPITVQHWGGKFERLADEIWEMMHELAGQTSFRSHTTHAWRPAINLYEADDRFVVCVELSGVDGDRIDVRFHDGALHIQGVRPRPVSAELPGDMSVALMEIDWGPFRRTIPIPGEVVRDKITAVYRQGYVWISLPRSVPSPE
jgi:HSP20 family protein